MKTRLLLLFSGILILLVGLAFVLNGTDLAPARPFVEREHTLLSGLPWNNDISPFILYIFLLMLIMSIFGLIFMALNQRKSRYVLILVALIIMVLLIFISQSEQVPIVMTPVPIAIQTGTPVVVETDEPVVELPVEEVEFTAEPPNWVSIAISLALILSLSGVGVGIFLVLRHRMDSQPGKRLAEEAELAINRLQAGEDLEETILNCYRKMVLIVSESQGIAREESATPREFETHLEQAGLPHAPLAGLTRLFEAVRYGEVIPGQAEDIQAIEYFQAIAAACQEKK